MRRYEALRNKSSFVIKLIKLIKLHILHILYVFGLVGQSRRRPLEGFVNELGQSNYCGIFNKLSAPSAVLLFRIYSFSLP